MNKSRQGPINNFVSGADEAVNHEQMLNFETEIHKTSLQLLAHFRLFTRQLVSRSLEWESNADVRAQTCSSGDIIKTYFIRQ
jgi:uncharacterized NAD(P)/FAD-binding protein YdhS